MKGYLAFPPPTCTASTPIQPLKAAEITSPCTTRSDNQGFQDTHIGRPKDGGNAEQNMTEGERRKRHECERALGERSEIEWVRAGGVLRDAFGRRDKERTEHIRQELKVQDMEKEWMARWDTYEARWRAMQSSTAPIGFAEFPWPLRERVTSCDLGALTRSAVCEFLLESLAVRTNPTTKRQRIRNSLLRWHPDKMSLVINRVVPDDLELVREGVHVVFGILKALQDSERTTFSLANQVYQISHKDEIYAFDVEANKRILQQSPWDQDPHYFKSCKISAVALIKMVIHARSGVPHEIMGLMQGKVIGNSIVIMDSFALPVQGTETRVNAANEANEYMVTYIQECEKVKRLENAIGWYHSHPGYGCWLSGIDVDTQMNNQQFQDPFVAVVIDPNRTISAGKVDIGAFRTYPKDYTPPASVASEYQSIPLAKIEDFGAHANQYYQLEVEIFKSSLDEELLGLLWNKYWVNTLSGSNLISNRAYAVSQITDLHEKLVRAQTTVANTRATVPTLKSQEEKGSNNKQEDKKKEDNQLTKAVKDSQKIAAEAQHGLISQILKDVIFSSRPSEEPDVSRVAKIVDAAMTIG